MSSHTGLHTISSGLLNSAGFVHKMLLAEGYDSTLVEVKDNNDIDKEVTKVKPDVVIIEALWVVPSKFDVLQKLHPNVTWIIRLHSEIPFIANEGIAMEWIYEYQKYKNVCISINSETTYNDLNALLPNKVVYLPNYYPVDFTNTNYKKVEKDVINVGCFGAVRPLKNQLYQATAAIEYANAVNKKLRFHINQARVENKGDSVLKNIRNLFLNNPKHELVQHGWLSHSDFKKLISTMDVGLQVSFTETFNIVAADFVDCNVPIVVSDQIEWMSYLYKAKPTDSKSIMEKMNFALKTSNLNIQFINKLSLWYYGKTSKAVWKKYLDGFVCKGTNNKI